MRRFSCPKSWSRSLSVVAVLCAAALITASTVRAQMPARRSGTEAVTADAKKRAAIIDSVAAALTEGYVFPQVAVEMEKTLRKNLKRGSYDDMDTVEKLAEALTRDLREISNDKHLGLVYIPPERMQEVMRQLDPDVDREREAARLARQNFMFKTVEILAGNVGYLRLDSFVDASYSGPTAVAAMNFLAHCDALIIDLRYNGGGSPSLIQLMTSYFFLEPTHLNSFYTPRTDSLEQSWTHAYVPGPRMPDVDLYVLTSNRTFSGAEEFTYNLKNLERATIIGETTGGGAHPVDRKLFPTLNLSLSIPHARAINPITGTNWEGTGVTPHIELPQEKALLRAHSEALAKLRETIEDPGVLADLEWAIGDLNTELNPVEIVPDILASYAGTYGPRKLTFKDGALYYDRDGGPMRRALPMSERLFRFEGIDFFRLEVVVDDSGTPVKLVGHYRMGFTDESPRTEGN